ncbi:MAG TPA: DUF885 domain-containing protein, partial [Candidatus Limnocylindria bacterium]|nr:DUF885 domain-containing protein [Candidatus Limnocylindria bacterium]
MHAPSDADARFDRTIERWFRQMVALDPEGATYLGIHDHDHRLSDGTREHVERVVAFHRDAIAEMERVPADELSADRALDRDLVIHEARLAIHQLAERRDWAGSSRGAEHIGNALFPIFTRDYAPLEERLTAIAARLEAAPAYLAQTRTRIDAPVRLWIEIDIEGSNSLPEFLDTILAVARSEHVDPTLLARLEAAARSLRAALDEHVAWLRHDALPRANGSWQAGPEGFDRLVELRALDATTDQILAVGEQMLAEETAGRQRVSVEIDPTLSPAEVTDLVKENHPATFPEAIEEYRKAMDRARDFIVEHDLATLPAQDRLRVIETPSYERHIIPFAAYYEPARFDPDPIGTYIVTPPGSPDMWREHNFASISNTSVHEAYPGHHLQLAAATANPSLVRAWSLSAAEFAEGWAFYCERMMKQAGFDDTPIHRWVMHTDAIWRAARIILDIRLHRGEMSVDEGVAFL